MGGHEAVKGSARDPQPVSTPTPSSAPGRSPDGTTVDGQGAADTGPPADTDPKPPGREGEDGTAAVGRLLARQYTSAWLEDRARLEYHTGCSGCSPRVRWRTRPSCAQATPEAQASPRYFTAGKRRGTEFSPGTPQSRDIRERPPGTFPRGEDGRGKIGSPCTQNAPMKRSRQSRERSGCWALRIETTVAKCVRGCISTPHAATRLTPPKLFCSQCRDPLLPRDILYSTYEQPTHQCRCT